MTETREFLNLLITRKLTLPRLKELKNGIVLNEDTLTVVLRIQKRRNLKKEEAKILSDLVAEWACESHSNVEFIFEFIEEQDALNSFQRTLLRKMKGSIPDITPKMKLFFDCYAV